MGNGSFFPGYFTFIECGLIFSVIEWRSKKAGFGWDERRG